MKSSSFICKSSFWVGEKNLGKVKKSFCRNHYDMQTWNQLSNDEFNASFRMMLFFLELDHDKELIKARGQVRK